MASLNQTIADIKSLKIQGAESAAKEAVKALNDFSRNFKGSERQLVLSLNTAARRLIEARATEPAMRNAIKYILTGASTGDGDAAQIKKRVSERVDFTLKHFEVSKQRIMEFGSRKVKKGSVIYTHCHSSSVVDVLKAAKRRGIDFEVHNTETRPRFQGRITAKELSDIGIKVVHYVDSGAIYALRKADMMLIGADAITSEGFVINKIGSSVFAEIAADENIPVYCCANSWKFDPATTKGAIEEIEERPADEVWPNAPKKIIVRNPAFELVDPRHITGIISELGVYRPEVFVEEVKMHYRWMF